MEMIAENLINAEPENPGHYVLLSNMYALAGRMDRVESVRNVMIQRGLKKQVGYSTIDVENRSYLFSMGDKSHPETNEIYCFLDELIWRCKDAGYAPVPESAMHELEGEEREYALRYHSEKLAVAFGLMKMEEEGEGLVAEIEGNIWDTLVHETVVVMDCWGNAKKQKLLLYDDDSKIPSHVCSLNQF